MVKKTENLKNIMKMEIYMKILNIKTEKKMEL